VESITVDDLDRQLVQCLGVDGRASFSAIAEVLGVSDQTVARRYRRLRSAGVIRVVGLRYPKGTGYANWFLRLRCVPGSGVAIADALAKRPDTTWVQLLSGDTEVLCALRGHGGEPPESLLARLPRSGRVVAVTAQSLLHMFTDQLDTLRLFALLPAERVEPLRHPLRPGNAGLGNEDDQLDVALFKELGADGRTPYADLASGCGWSETTVRRRVDQLRDAGVLRFAREVDLPTFGYRMSAWLWLSVPPARLAEIGTALASFPEIVYATATTGAANLAVCAVCRDEEALYDFLTGKVGSLPGVERLESAPVIRVVKQASPVPVLRP
jgi:DNA-binding Lrp family transcriptional regulator